MEYSCYHYHHIGHYRCTQCGHHRPVPDFAVTDLDLGTAPSPSRARVTIHLAFRSIYNVYNILAAWSVCSLAAWASAIMARSSAAIS